AVAAWVLRRRGGVATGLAVLTTLIGAGCLIAAAATVVGGAPQVWTLAWALPFGTPSLRLDPLAGVFLLPIACIGALGVIFAAGYLRLGHRDTPIGAALAGFEMLLAVMALVIVAANTVLLLMAWEVMTLLSWQLMVSEHEHADVRTAGLIYLIAGHVSGAALLLLFVFIAQTGTGWAVPMAPLGGGAGLPSVAILLGLAWVGFGTKAAIAPLHVWLPDAHAAAPSHVSALMSGVLITLGFYGLLRFLPVLGPPGPVWGMALMGLGALGACGGVVMALSQRDVKRVLAYSTIEHAGLVTMAMGAALVATAMGRPGVAALAWTVVLLHLWNHAVAKSLLFFTGGAIAQLVGSRDLERWGGLMRRLPALGVTLLIGAAAVVGLPGTHGFASEWLLFMSLFRGSQELTGPPRLVMLLGAVAAAFTVGAALPCFVRLVGVGLLGHARSREAADATPPRGPWVILPALVLAGMSLALVVLIHPLLDLLGPAVEQLAPGASMAAIQRLVNPLPWNALLVPGGVAAFAVGRMFLKWRRPVRRAVTWDCGYAQPAATMQYTASSLAQPVTRVLQPALRTTVRWHTPRGPWPGAMEWEARTPERALAELYRPVFARLAQLLGFFTRLQEGQVMVYLRYVGIALLLLLGWLFLAAGPSR
ncbi:MAG: proton-conducting transporter membrane subunit, partial [Candidatus Eisenbacteria bacterium]